MTFPARLTELLEKAGLSLADHAKLKEFLDDHAEALRDLVVAAEKIEPYLDAIICYASTMGEHEPNRIANNFRKAITELNKS